MNLALKFWLLSFVPISPSTVRSVMIVARVLFLLKNGSRHYAKSTTDSVNLVWLYLWVLVAYEVVDILSLYLHYGSLLERVFDRNLLP